MKEKKFKKGIMKRLFSIVLALTMVFTLVLVDATEVKAAEPELEPTLVETIYSTGIDDAGRWIFGKDFKVTSYHKILCEDGAYHWHIVSNYSTLNVESVKGKVFSKLVLHLMAPYSDTRLPNLPSYAVVTFSADKKTITISNLRETYIEIETYTSFNHAEVKSVDIYSGPCALSHMDGQNPTCEKDGWKDYYQCIDTTCRKIYASNDPSGTSYSSLDDWKASSDGKMDALGHDFSYSLETTNTTNDTIKATCSRSDKCDLTNADKSISLVLSTKDKYYDGYNYTGDELGGTGKWYELGLQIPRVKYVGRGDTIYSESEMRPREVGTYTAKISASDPEVTATADFEIKELPADAAPLCYCLNPAHVMHYYTFSDGLGFYVYNGTTYNRTETKAIAQLRTPTYAYVTETINPDEWYYKSEGVYVKGGVCVQSAAPLHTHKWNYKSDGETMYAYCTETEGIEYCVYQGTSEDLSKAASFTITTDARGFTGIDNIDSFNKATKLELSENDVKFYKVETEGVTTGGEDVTGTFLKKGFYYAAFSIGNQTAVKAFSLAKDAPKPLTFKASEASTIKFKTAQFTGVKYNKNGSGWTKYTSEEVINLNADEYVQFKGICTSIPTMSTYAQFTMTGKIEASGDITSLIDNIGGDVSLASVGASSGMSNGVFYKLFQNCTSLTKAPNLPSTELGNACYSELFSGCTELTEAPELPATTVPGSCYRLMFRDCTNLTATPNLPATTIDDYCYVSMFSGCTNLTTVPESLPATTLAKSCYASMFSGCTKITTAPELPATTAAYSCYQQMFLGCTNLAKAPELPATTLNTYCYWSMFEGCEALTEAPELPAATMEDRCYNYMFKGCARLKKAPELPATTLASECYAQMFSGCTSLKILPELPAPTLESYCYSRMFDGCTSIELKPAKVNGTHETEWIISATSDNVYWYQNMFNDCPKVEIGVTPALNTTYYQRGSSHTHSFTYSVTDDAKNTLVATCTNEDGKCMLDDGSETHAHSVSLTISAEDKNYSGSPATVTIGSQAEKEAWENAGLIVPTTIYYEKADGTNLRAHAPVDAGSYVAKVCPEGNMPREIDTAKASFTIARLESTATVPTAKTGLVYTGTAQELVNAGSTDCGIFKYALSVDGTFAENVPIGTDAGSYYVYYKLIGDVNHTDKEFDTPITVTISKATYSGTKTATGNILAGYATNDMEVTLPAIPDHMTYGTPSFSAPFTSVTIEGGKVKYSANNTAIAGTGYTITVPVSEKSGESANYNNYNITITLTGLNCSHSSATPISEAPATCTVDGVKAHDLCSVCGLKLIDGVVMTDAGLKIEKLGHNWEYTANGTTLTAACSRNATCGQADLTLTLTATSANYSGSAVEATMDKTAWETAGLIAPSIVYEAKTGSALTEGKAKNVGSYTAKISVGDPAVTASVDFDIHGASTTYASDDTNHWFTCAISGCTDTAETHKFNKAAHSYDATSHECVCGKIDPTYHQHVLGTKHNAVAGTCTTAGTLEYYDCAGTLGGACGKKLDASGNELTSITGTKDPSNHAGTATTWTKTATTHKETYDCCGAVKTAEADHTYGTTGTARYTCSVCSYEDTTKKAAAELADAKEAAKAAIDTEVGTDTTANVVKAADDAKAAIDAAETTEAVTTAKEAGIEAVKAVKAANALAAAKEAAKAAIDTEVGTDTSANVVKAADDAKAAIDAATSLTAVSDAELDGVAKIAELQNKNKLEAVKNAAKAEIDSEAGTDTSANVKKAADDAKAAIEAATTVDDVKTETDKGIEAIEAAKAANALAAAKEVAKAAIDTEVGDDTSANVKKAADDAKAAIDAAETTTAVTTAKEAGIEAIKAAKAANALAAAKEAAKKAIADEKGDDTSANVVKAAEDANKAIEDATSVEDVNKAKEAGIEAIKAAKAANAFAAAKEAARKAIADEKGDDTSANVVKAAEDANKAIEDATSVEDVNKAKEAGIKAIKDAKAANAADEAAKLAAAKEAAKKAIDTEVGGDTTPEVVAAAKAAKDAIDAATTATAVSDAELDGIAKIAELQHKNKLDVVKKAAKSEIDNEVGTDTSANVKKAADDAKAAIDAATTVKDVETATDKGIEAIKAAKAANAADEAAKLAAAKEAAKKAIDTEVGSDTTPEVVAAAKAAKDAIDAATTVTAVSDAELDGIAKIAELQHKNKLDVVKKVAKSEIDNEAGTDTSANVKKAADDAKAAIDAATTVKDVETATDKGIEAIKAAKAANNTDDGSKLAAAKTDAKAAIDTEVGTDIASNVKKASNEAKAAIEAAKTPAEVTTAKEAGIKAIKEAKAANAAEEVPEFKDVVVDSWYEKGIQFVWNCKFMFGYDDPVTKLPTGEFGIKDALTREQFAMIMYRISGEPEVTYTGKFVDVPDGKYYSKAIEWCAANGIVTGYLDGSGKYGVGDSIKRQDAALILYRYEKEFLKKDVSNNATFDSFKDGDTVSKYAEEAMKWAVASGVITGKSNVVLDPKVVATREEGATMVMRFMNR